MVNLYKKNVWKLMEIFCRFIYVFLCVILIFWGGRVFSWGRCWWKSDCGLGRCAFRISGFLDLGSIFIVVVDLVGFEIR